MRSEEFDRTEDEAVLKTFVCKKESVAVNVLLLGFEANMQDNTWKSWKV